MNKLIVDPRGTWAMQGEGSLPLSYASAQLWIQSIAAAAVLREGEGTFTH